jgi:glycine/D-amino acid oxidase-like deaminating enzyme
VLTEEGSLFLEDLEFDVVVVGAGVIGLTVANRILDETPFSVAVVDAKRPCAGATGAGEVFLWEISRSLRLISRSFDRSCDC